MGINNLVRTRGFKNFMAKLYGWGAAVVMVGALFKLQHYNGAGIMLIIGLGTEATIFFFSAFEPPHVEPDWSLVYPELAGMYHGYSDEETNKKGTKKSNRKTDSVTQELDKMLSEAKIGPELIESLSKGLRNLNNTTAKLSDVSDISLANSEFIANIKNASDNAAELSDSYKKTSELLNKDLGTSEDYLNNIKNASVAAAKLSDTYDQTSESIKANSKTYKEALENITRNLSALNTIYEVQLKSTEKQADSSMKLNEKIAAFVNNIDGTIETSSKYKQNLVALNTALELQLEGSTENIDANKKFKDTLNKLLINLNESSERTLNYKESIDNLAKNIAALNNVYGNMLAAMNVNNK